MSKDQLKALIAKLKEDAILRENLKNCTDLESAIRMIQDLGFAISKADIIREDAEWINSLSDAELEAVAGGRATNPAEGDSICIQICYEQFVSQYFPCNTNVGPWWTPGNCKG